MDNSKGGSELYFFGAVFWQIGNAWKRRAAAVLRPLNITYVQFMVLKTVDRLYAQDRIISQIDIANALQANPMVVSSVIRALKKERLISVRTHPKDSRAKRVLLSQKGVSALKESVLLIQEMECRFFEIIQENDTLFTQKLEALAHAHPFTLEA